MRSPGPPGTQLEPRETVLPEAQRCRPCPQLAADVGGLEGIHRASPPDCPAYKSTGHSSPAVLSRRSGQLWSRLDGAASKAGTARWPQLGRQWATASGLEGQAGEAPGLGAGRQGSAAPRPTMPETEGARWAGDDARGDFQGAGAGVAAECSLCDLREEGSWRRKGSVFKCNLEET